MKIPFGNRRFTDMDRESQADWIKTGYYQELLEIKMADTIKRLLRI